MLRVVDLRKRYGDRVAVDGVSFEVARGESFGLLGPDGAGKTTTINMIVGMLAPDGGSVEIDGESDPTRTRVRRKLGVAPQALAIYEDLSADENLRFFGSLYGLAGADLRMRVDRALELAGLADQRRELAKGFSDGLKRRLNLACALVHDPQILVLDEPTVDVDAPSRNHILETIERLKEGGRTILYTTHSMEDATRLCDRVAIMDHGKLLGIRVT